MLQVSVIFYFFNSLHYRISTSHIALSFFTKKLKASWWTWKMLAGCLSTLDSFLNMSTHHTAHMLLHNPVPYGLIMKENLIIQSIGKWVLHFSAFRTLWLVLILLTTEFEKVQRLIKGPYCLQFLFSVKRYCLNEEQIMTL